jgi:hypothetical protein
MVGNSDGNWNLVLSDEGFEKDRGGVASTTTTGHLLRVAWGWVGVLDWRVGDGTLGDRYFKSVWEEYVVDSVLML